MKFVNSVILASTLLISMEANAQWSALVRLIMKDASHSARPASEYIIRRGPEYLTAEQKLLREISGTQLGRQIRENHPGTDYMNIKLTYDDYQTISDHQKNQSSGTVTEVYYSTADDILKKVAKEPFDRLYSASSEPALNNVTRNDPKTYMSMPSSPEEYENIFKEYDENIYNNVATIRKKIEDKQQVNFLGSASDIYFALADGNSDPILLVGHNENGAMQLPDGSSELISEIASHAKENGRIVVFLSCNAANYTTMPAARDFLNYAQAANIALYIKYKLANISQNEVSTRVIQGIIDSYVAEKKAEFALKVIGYGSGGILVGYGLYEINMKPDK